MINEHVCVDSARLRLVPYLPQHVQRYHEWMCEPDLLAATESEPLSLEEEQENQHAWLQSVDKLTFILLAPLRTIVPSSEHQLDALLKTAPVGPIVAAGLSSVQDTSERLSAAHPDAHRCSSATLTRVRTAAALVVDDTKDTLWLAAPLEETGAMPLPICFIPGGARHLVTGASLATSHPTETETFVMIGDCNLFLLDPDELDTGDTSDEDALAAAARRRCRCFEVEVMVADKAFRRRGLAEQAVRLLMQYAVSVLGATCFVAKILTDNTASIRLFQDKLHFSVYKEVKVFHEVHLVRYLATEAERKAWWAECQERCMNAGDAGDALCSCRPYDASLEASMVVLPRSPV